MEKRKDKHMHLLYPINSKIREGIVYIRKACKKCDYIEETPIL